MILSMVESGLGISVMHSLLADMNRYHVVWKRFDLRRYAKIQMIALTAMAAVVALLALFVLPKAAAALAEMEAAARALASVDVVGMAERVDALVQKGSDSMDEAMRGLETGLADLDRALQVLEGIDLESLNESIASLSAILEPLSRLFGR